jgi:hypothetical protein
MATARHSEMWDQLQLTKRLNQENGSYVLYTGRGNRPRASVKKVLRNVCETKIGEVTGQRKLHNEELHNFYSSSDVIRTVTSGMKRRAGQTVLVGRTGNRKERT